MNDMVRTLNNVLNPGDAQRLEDQARRNGRPQEERYWRDYRAGLDSPDRYRRDKPDRDRGGELQATSLRERRLVKPVGDTIDCVGVIPTKARGSTAEDQRGAPYVSRQAERCAKEQ
jgi:hypothetical protein